MSDTLQLVVNAPYIQPGRIETAQAQEDYGSKLRERIASVSLGLFVKLSLGNVDDKLKSR